MATSLMQKLRLAWHGWQRRREDADREFLAKNASWGPAGASAPAPRPSGPQVDLEGLQVAYLDDSGRITYYLDTETGDVVDVHDGRPLALPRYRPVPRRSEASDAADRRAFVEKLGLRIAHADAAEFRRAIAADRSVERAWYNFKNEQATAAVTEWLARGRPAR
jgi:hypothetical protein